METTTLIVCAHRPDVIYPPDIIYGFHSAETWQPNGEPLICPSFITDSNFYELSLVETKLYSLIYSFHHNHNEAFSCTPRYAAMRCDCTPTEALEAFDSLYSLGLIDYIGDHLIKDFDYPIWAINDNATIAGEAAINANSSVEKLYVQTALGPIVLTFDNESECGRCA